MSLFDAIGDVAEGASYALDPLNFSGIRESEASKALKKQRAALEALQNPELRDLSAEDYRKYLVNQQSTQLNKAPTTGRSAQANALQQMQDIASQGGLTSADRARLQDIRNQEAIAEKGQRESILQNAQSRGVAGSGLELAQQLAAQQGGATRASSRDLGVADIAQQRALAAIQNSAQIGGNLQGQDYQRASAQDEINRFNTEYKNRAGIATAGNRQDIQYQNQIALPQMRAQNSLNRTLGITGVGNQIGQARDAQAQQTRNTVQDVAGLFAGLPPTSGTTSGASRMAGNTPNINTPVQFDVPQLGYDASKLKRPGF